MNRTIETKFGTIYDPAPDDDALNALRRTVYLEAKARYLDWKLAFEASRPTPDDTLDDFCSWRQTVSSLDLDAPYDRSESLYEVVKASVSIKASEIAESPDRYLDRILHNRDRSIPTNPSAVTDILEIHLIALVNSWLKTQLAYEQMSKVKQILDTVHSFPAWLFEEAPDVLIFAERLGVELEALQNYIRTDAHCLFSEKA